MLGELIRPETCQSFKVEALDGHRLLVFLFLALRWIDVCLLGDVRSRAWGTPHPWVLDDGPSSRFLTERRYLLP